MKIQTQNLFIQSNDQKCEQIAQIMCYQQNQRNQSTSSSENNQKNDLENHKVLKKDTQCVINNGNNEQQMNLAYLASKLQKLQAANYEMEKNYLQKIKNLQGKLRAKNSDSQQLTKILVHLSDQSKRQKEKIKKYVKQMQFPSKIQILDSESKNCQINASYYALHKQEDQTQKQTLKCSKLKGSRSQNMKTSGSLKLLSKQEKNKKYLINYVSYNQEQPPKLQKKVQSLKQSMSARNLKKK